MGHFGRAILPVLLWAAASSAAEDHEVSGTVLDERGEPAAGVDVSGYWFQRDGALAPQGGVRTDGSGRFTLRVRWQKRARTLLAMDAARERGAIVVLDEAGLAREHTLALGPLVALRGAIGSTGLGHAPETVTVSATLDGAIIAAAAATGGASFSLPLPPGTYRLAITPRHCKRLSRTVTLAAGAGALDLGTIDAEPTVIARHYGKPLPPWTVTEARGAGKDVQLADYRGKWVLIEFWGFW